MLPPEIDSLPIIISCVVALVIASIVYTYQIRTSSHAKRPPLPPGPPREQLAGNAKQLPSTEPWKAYHQWSQIYGPVVYLRIFTRHVVVLNTAKVVSDLLDKRSAIYSDRPKMWMYQELVGRGLTPFAISSEHDRFKRYRKTMNGGLNPRATQDHREVMRSETHTLLQGLVSTPDKFANHIRRNAGAIIMKITYGYTVSSDDDYFVDLVEKSTQLVIQAQKPGRWLVDYFPIMRFIPVWFPGADFQRQAKYFRIELANLSMIPHQWAKHDYVESFTSRLLNSCTGPAEMPMQDIDAEEEDFIMSIAAALYVGGADTTVAALTTFFLVMCLHPDIQHRAQAEIDEKVGRNRLPTFEDQSSLVYVGAVIKEVLRWAPVAPLGLPHSNTREDEYEGYRIPRGTTVIANIWAIMHDEAVYPNPFHFAPERFIESENGNIQVDPSNLVFGFGRRVCPGAHFAQQSLFLTIANLLSAFNIEKARNELTGEEIDPDVQFTTGVTSHAKPFKCRIRLRDDAAMLI